MSNIVKKAVLGATLAATALTAAAPAEAQRWRRHRGNGGDVAAGAIIGGIVGLGIGAAIASNNRRDRYYDRGYYDRGYYDRRGLRGGYYDRGYAYDRGYYPQRGYGYYDDYRSYRPRCYTVRQYDPYYGRRIRTRVCD